MPERTLIGSRTFTTADQENFATLSGDRNPMHMNPVWARRTYAGFPVVHGVHTALVGIELALVRGIAIQPLSVRAIFQQPIVVGEPVEYFLSYNKHSVVRIEASVSEIVRAIVDISPHRSARIASLPSSITSDKSGAVEWVESTNSLDLALPELHGRHGNFVPRNFAVTSEYFPALLAMIGKSRLDAIAATSYLVGMICPGLHSIFSTLDVDLEGPEQAHLSYSVRAVDERFRKVTESVSGCGVTALIEAFARVPPVQQPRLAELASVVEQNEFAGCHALIIGGSRGLGEVAAKIVAAGGGAVTLTYAVGSTEAEAVAHEIRSAGGTCRVVRFDAIKDDPQALIDQLPSVSHLLYFATPRIGEPRRPDIFSRPAFDRYLEFYVNAFARLCAAIGAQSDRRIGVLFPSSAAVDDPPPGFCEYAMAKAAGETLCKSLSKSSKLFFSAPRYPRILTDQTATVVPTSAEPIAEVVLQSIRALMTAGRSDIAT